MVNNYPLYANPMNLINNYREILFWTINKYKDNLFIYN